MIRVKVHGNFNKLEAFLNKKIPIIIIEKLNKAGKKGVDALAAATPFDSGKTASSWSYKINRTKRGYSVEFINSNVNEGVPIAIILQYGHGTRNGGYVQGRDYINPAIRPIFDEIADETWKEVIR